MSSQLSLRSFFLRAGNFAEIYLLVLLKKTSRDNNVAPQVYAANLHYEIRL